MIAWNCGRDSSALMSGSALIRAASSGLESIASRSRTTVRLRCLRVSRSRSTWDNFSSAATWAIRRASIWAAPITGCCAVGRGRSLGHLESQAGRLIVKVHLAVDLRQRAIVSREALAAGGSVLAEPDGLALVFDGGGECGLGVGRFPALVQPFSLLGQDDAEMALELDRFGGGGDELLEIGEGLIEARPRLGQTLQLHQQARQVVLSDGQVVTVVDRRRLAGQKILGDGDRAAEGVLGPGPVQDAQVGEDLGLSALPVGRGAAAWCKVENGQGLAIHRLGPLRAITSSQDDALVPQADGLPYAIVDAFGVTGDQAVVNRGGRAESCVPPGLSRDAHGPGHAVKVGGQVALVAGLVGVLPASSPH